MALFDELRTHKKMEDPEERTAGDLVRSPERSSRRVRVSETSVTSKKFNITMGILKFIGFIAIIVVCYYLIRFGVTKFIPGES